MSGYFASSVRRRLAPAATAAVAAKAGVASCWPSAAQAYTRIDPQCLLRSVRPYSTGYDGYNYGGRIDCTGAGPGDVMYESEIQVCSQVYNFSNRRWYTINGSCDDRNHLNRDYGGNANPRYGPDVIGRVGVPGHVYRSWVWGWVNNYTYGVHSATYTSSGWTCCSGGHFAYDDGGSKGGKADYGGKTNDGKAKG